MLNFLSKFDGYMAMLITLMVLMMKMVVVMAGILSFFSLESAKETLVEVYFCFFDAEVVREVMRNRRIAFSF